jgi:hypothetical protein
MDTVPVLPGPTPITLSVIRGSSFASAEGKLYWIPVLGFKRAPGSRQLSRPLREFERSRAMKQSRL